MELEIRHYVSPSGRDVYRGWLDGLRDRRGQIAVARRIARAAGGNLGDYSACRDGVWELRIDVGPGYRVYFAIDAGAVVLLLGGGDKSSQARDIDRALDAWRDYQWRKCNGQAVPQP